MPVSPKVKVEGLRDLQREVRRAKSSELNAEMKRANKAAAEVAVKAGKPQATRQSGRLAASVKAVNSSRYAAVKAGTAKTVPYAGVIHYGWPKRNIKPSPFLIEAIARNFKAIESAYEEALTKVAQLLNSK